MDDVEAFENNVTIRVGLIKMSVLVFPSCNGFPHIFFGVTLSFSDIIDRIPITHEITGLLF